MHVPYVQIISRFARDTHMPGPRRPSLPKLKEHIRSLPEGWVDPEEILNQLDAELDGARPVA